jgi:hypothetical protein
MQRAITGTLLIVFGYIFWWSFIYMLQNHYFYYYEWLDIPMHIAGGFLIGLIFSFILSVLEDRKIYILRTRDKIMDLFLFVLVIGIGWEVLELTSNFTFEASRSLGDTLGDLLMDLVGGAICVVVLLFIEHLSKRRHE